MRNFKLTVAGIILMFAIAGKGMAANVVVIPLGGSSGTAQAADVLKGKTFSNSSKEGISGTRPPAPNEKTGQTVKVATGDDGDIEAGEAWPVPRFWTGVTLFGEGNADYLTGLSWETTPSNILRNWVGAVNYCKDLVTGSIFFGYSDWRLPNIKEYLSLIDYGKKLPALPAGHPYNVIVGSDVLYWTSTTHMGTSNLTRAWVISLNFGDLGSASKTLATEYAWCVRGPY